MRIRCDEVKQKLAFKDYSLIDSSIVIENYLDKQRPYIIKYSLTTKPEVVNGKVYISPFLRESLFDNPLKQKERTYPIDMIYPKKKVYSSTLSIPEGYQIDFLPEELKMNNETFELNYSVNTIDNKVQIVFEYYFKKPVYPSTDYSKIKYYFNEIVKKGSEKIVVTKKTLAGNQEGYNL